MASLFARRPVLTIATATSILGSAYYISQQPRLRLDSAGNEPTNTVAFPRTMLFAKQLTVKSVEQLRNPNPTYATQRLVPTRGALQLLVKKYPNGRSSGHMHSLAPGETLTVRGPLPGYTSTPSYDKDRAVILVAGGAGITPIYSLAKGILHDSADRTKVQLLWGVNGTRDIVLKSELEELEQRYPGRLSVTYVVSGPEAALDATSLRDGRKWRTGYVNKALIEEAMRKAKQSSWGDEKGTKVFLCGPPRMEDALAGRGGVLGELGLGKKEIHRF
ncbi:cytochrome-b5 reductase [Teratosphaeria nubilosa]|uniref:NADH-cytochrome b5 reductase 2 n=1 Tax=Teratosphaeria nubilosa TaxID=161662 RepID=A0A6G1L0B8_9PEZI|nr:cytochrome-b5 reductase [Teratosphaeria nubilosa]